MTKRTFRYRRRLTVNTLLLLLLSCTPVDNCRDSDSEIQSALLLALLLTPTDPCPSNSYSYSQNIGTSGSADGQFQDPWGLAISPDQKLYVTDAGTSRIQRCTLDGVFEARFGSTAVPTNGAFDTPSGLAFDQNGNFYVAKIGNTRVQSLDSSGNHIAILASNGGADGQVV